MYYPRAGAGQQGVTRKECWAVWAGWREGREGGCLAQPGPRPGCYPAISLMQPPVASHHAPLSHVPPQCSWGTLVTLHFAHSDHKCPFHSSLEFLLPGRLEWAVDTDVGRHGICHWCTTMLSKEIRPTWHGSKLISTDYFLRHQDLDNGPLNHGRGICSFLASEVLQALLLNFFTL